MEPITVGIVSIVLLLIFLGLGFQIGLNFLLVGVISGTFIIGFNRALILLGETMYYSVASPTFASLPLFVLMGAFATRGGFAKRAFEGVYTATAGLPGSLGIATCYSCAAFGAISGSSLATAAVFGKLVLPEMARYKYNKSLALGCIASAGTFAAMIPPSIGFIVYAMFTDQSIGRLFAAGILPGIITATVYSISIIYRVKKNPELAPSIADEKKFTIKQKIFALKKTGPILTLALIVLGGIYSGLFTPTEAAAAGAFATLIFGIRLGKLGKLEYFKQSLRESAQITSMLFIIIVGAMFYSRILSLTRIPVELSLMLQGWDVPRVFILGGILMIWFILGMIMNPTSIYALTLPIIFPIVTRLGYDPIWFGVIACKLGEIAAVTPPVGLNVYALKGVASEDTTIEEVFSGIWPFVVCDIVVLILLIAFPQITLFLPNLLLGH